MVRVEDKNGVYQVDFEGTVASLGFELVLAMNDLAKHNTQVVKAAIETFMKNNPDVAKTIIMEMIIEEAENESTKV